MSQAVKDKLEAERLERNKVRIFDLMVKIEEMFEADVDGVAQVSFARHPTEDEDDTVDTKLKPGFHVRLKCYDSPEDLLGTYLRRVLRIDSEEWEFDALDEYLNQLQWRADEKQRKKDERDAELRNLSPKQREILGFGSWRDPQTSQV